MGYFAPDPDASPGYFTSADPSLVGAPDLSVPFGSPPLNSARGSSAAALLARAMSPYVQTYEDFGVAPLRPVINTLAHVLAPAFDPAFLMSMAGVFPAFAVPATAEGIAAKGLRALAEIRTPGLPLSERADEILGALTHPNAIKNRTVAVLRTDGPTIIGSGKRDIDRAQREMLRPGEVEARLPGEDAEITTLQDAQERGAAPSALGTSRTICPACQQAIEAAGGWVDSPRTARFPGPEWPWVPPY